MVPPEDMTRAAHRAQLWAEMRRALWKLLQDGDEQRELYADHAIRSVSRVGDKAIREVLAVVDAHEQREVAAVKEWRVVRREPAQLPFTTSPLSAARRR